MHRKKAIWTPSPADAVLLHGAIAQGTCGPHAQVNGSKSIVPVSWKMRWTAGGPATTSSVSAPAPRSPTSPAARRWRSPGPAPEPGPRLAAAVLEGDPVTEAARLARLPA